MGVSSGEVGSDLNGGEVSIWWDEAATLEAVGYWAARYRWQELIAMLPFLLPV